MIAKVTKGKSFASLARYLEAGRDGGDNPDRVSWIETRNLPTDDPRTASLLMRATAAQSVRTEKPVYHMALSFNPEDAVDRATMARVADRLMSDLGLRDHQALIVAHGDTHHAHLHVMVNRVHPETSRAWHPSHDYARVERSLREQERELGFRAVPGNHFRLDAQERPDRTAQADRATGQESPAAPVRAEAGAGRRDAGSRNPGEGTEPPRSRPPHGRNDPTHGGADGRAEAAQPAPDRSAERSPHERSGSTRRQEPAHPSPDRKEATAASTSTLNPRQQAVGRTLDQLDRRIQLERTRDTTRDELDRAHMRLLPHTAQRAEARQASARFRAALAEVYRDPAEARRAFHTRAEQVGAPTAAAEMARQPGRFGHLQGTQVGPIRSAERAAALRTAPKLETLATEHVRRVREAWSHRAEYRHERATVTRLERHLKTINYELGRSPGRADLEQRLSRQLQRLERPHLKTLRRALPLPQQRLVAAAVRVARAFAHEQGHER